MSKTDEKEKEFLPYMKEITKQIYDSSVSDMDIWNKILETPEVIGIKNRLRDETLFMAACKTDRIELAKRLAEHGADIHYASEASLYQGNALNGATTPEMAEWLLSLGLSIERNLIILESERPTKFTNPVILAVEHNDPVMIHYWLKKEKEILADDPDYLKELFRKTIVWALTWQCNPKICAALIEDDEIYPYLLEVFRTDADPENIKAYKRVLKKAEDEKLKERIAELTKALSRKKTKAVPADKAELVKLICTGLQSAVEHIREKYKNEEVYILSIEVDRENLSFFVYFNTEENHTEKLKQECDDPWYYRFCENEWYVLENAPELIKDAGRYLKSIDGQIGINEIYECIVTALEQSREKIYKVFDQPVFLTVLGSEVFDEAGMIEIVKRLNGEDNCKDYIENIEVFY